MKYVVAKYDSFDGVISLKLVTAESKIDALLCEMQIARSAACNALGEEEFEAEDLINLSYRWDTPIEILELEADSGS